MLLLVLLSIVVLLRLWLQRLVEELHVVVQIVPVLVAGKEALVNSGRRSSRARSYELYGKNAQGQALVCHFVEQ